MPAKLYRVHLTDVERKELSLLIQNRSHKSEQVKRAYLLLAADQDGEKGWKDKQIQQAYGMSIRSIERLGERFVLEGLSTALKGKKREVFRQKRFTGEVEAKLIALRCSDPPKGYNRWTLQLLADKMVALSSVESISDESVRQLLKNIIKPWQVKSWIIPEASAQFVCRMEAVLSVYEQAYDEKHPKVCLDESPKQLISESRKGFVDRQGVQHIDYEYRREGVADLYMLVEPLAGQRQVWVEENHNRFTYAKIIAQIAEELYPNAEQVTIVEDNLSAHKLSALYEIFEPDRARRIIERINIVRTPTHGSWLNVAECELSVLTRQGLKTHVATRQELEQQVKAWYEQRNDQRKKVDWQFTTKDARIKLKKLYPSFNA